MPFVKDETEETKNRIVEVAKQHFSEDGFDATSVDGIAKDAGVNKALIYYYFKSKEAILDHIIQKLFDDMASIARSFIENNVVAMIRAGKLDIERERWRFSSEADAQSFYKAGLRYYEEVVDFALSHRSVVRILIFESLKNSKHHNDLFRVMDMFYNKDEDSLFMTICNADQDFHLSPDNLIFKLFFGFIPLFNFAAYYDDFVKSSGISEVEIRASFLQAYAKMTSVYFKGAEIIV